MMNENMMNGEMMDFVELNDEDMAEISGGKTKIGAVTGDTYVRTGPGLKYKTIGVLHKGDETKYLGKSSTDDRGVAWYKVDWNGRTGWVSSRYTRKAKY